MHKRMHQLDHAHIHCVMAQCGFLCKAVMRQSVAKMSCKVGRELGRETPGPGKLERLRVLLRVQTALLHTARLVLSIVCAFKIQYVSELQTARSSEHSTPVLSYFLFSAACVRALAQHRGSANVFWVYTFVPTHLLPGLLTQSMSRRSRYSSALCPACGYHRSDRMGGMAPID
jgi:hypothetical protein